MIICGDLSYIMGQLGYPGTAFQWGELSSVRVVSNAFGPAEIGFGPDFKGGLFRRNLRGESFQPDLFILENR